LFLETPFREARWGKTRKYYHHIVVLTVNLVRALPISSSPVSLTCGHVHVLQYYWWVWLRQVCAKSLVTTNVNGVTAQRSDDRTTSTIITPWS
jgi:hypothetical protein